MIKKYLRTSLLLTVGAMLTWGFSSCEKNNDPIEKELTEKQKEMSQIAKQYVDNTVNLTYKNLAAETSELYDKLKAAKEKFLKDPKSLTQAEVDEICKTFIKARSSYEQSEAFLFGAATDFGVDPHIDTWPLDVDGLAAALTNKYQLEKLGGDENDAIAYAAGKLGQELLGFHGIEFVIFRNGKNRTVAALQASRVAVWALRAGVEPVAVGVERRFDEVVIDRHLPASSNSTAGTPCCALHSNELHIACIAAVPKERMAILVEEVGSGLGIVRIVMNGAAWVVPMKMIA